MEKEIFNQEIASEIMKNVYKGLVDRDYKLFSSNFHTSMLEGLPESLFVSTLKEFDDIYGEISEPQWASYDKPEEAYITLWKAVAGKTGNDIQITLSLTEVDDKWQVVGLYFK